MFTAKGETSICKPQMEETCDYTNLGKKFVSILVELIKINIVPTPNKPN